MVGAPKTSVRRLAGSLVVAVGVAWLVWSSKSSKFMRSWEGVVAPAVVLIVLSYFYSS